MISVIRQFSSNVTLPYAYKLAGQLLVSSEPVDSLKAFYTKGFSIPKKPSIGLDMKGFEALSQFELLTLHNSDLQYKGEAFFDQEMRTIHFWRSGDLAQIDVDGIPSCRLDFQAQCIVILNELSFDSTFNIELIVGPALILLLAHQSIFCLHAGAVSCVSLGGESINIAFLANSGVGKSTMSKTVDSNWQQLCDDILPIHLDGEVQLFNDFPQLKLKNAKTKEKAFKNNGLSYIFCIDPNHSEEVIIDVVPSIESSLSIVRHTVASRLFGQKLLRRHIDFANKLSQQVTVLKISYPRDLQLLPEVQRKIIEFISS